MALFGGAYNNWLALRATVRDAQARGARETWFLGDAGGFGPHPDRTVELLRELPLRVVAGNYDHSVGRDRPDCACGYTDPRDNHFARISYAYTLDRTHREHKAWLAALPEQARIEVGGRQVLLCHGSPRRQNEFLWQSDTPAAFVRHLCEQHQADLICCTHTGIHWQRRLPDGRGVVNVGAIGRPANDGRTCTWYTLLHPVEGGGVRAEAVPVVYDHERLAREMEAEGLPPEFVETIRTGWWTTCLEILPPRERQAGRY
ncbi:metallophosphatase family protein [Myxococcota bacterium]|nr:metallophosphatase family protein [Myxococcota bacterium]